MKEIRCSETSVHTRSTRRHIPEDGILHSHRRENLEILQSAYMFNIPAQSCGILQESGDSLKSIGLTQLQTCVIWFERTRERRISWNFSWFY
jgi:hypothetical protein